MPNRLTLHNGIPEHEQFCNCLHCRLEWEDDQEAKYALRLLDAQEIELRQARPATDEEWAAFMGLEWPRAKEGVTT